MENDLEQLLEKSTEIMRREINTLFTASASRKLGPTEARDLVAYIKLLTDLVEEQRRAAGAMDEEALRAALQKADSIDTGDQTGD